MSGKGMGKNKHGVYNDDPGPSEQKAGPSIAPSVPFIAGPIIPHAEDAVMFNSKKNMQNHNIAKPALFEPIPHPTTTGGHAHSICDPEGGHLKMAIGHHRPRILAHRTHLGCVPGLFPTALRSLRYRAPVDYLDLIQDGADQAAFPFPQSR
jgi:hypothetical protein